MAFTCAGAGSRGRRPRRSAVQRCRSKNKSGVRGKRKRRRLRRITEVGGDRITRRDEQMSKAGVEKKSDRSQSVGKEERGPYRDVRRLGQFSVAQPRQTLSSQRLSWRGGDVRPHHPPHSRYRAGSVAPIAISASHAQRNGCLRHLSRRKHRLSPRVRPRLPRRLPGPVVPIRPRKLPDLPGGPARAPDARHDGRWRRHVDSLPATSVGTRSCVCRVCSWGRDHGVRQRAPGGVLDHVHVHVSGIASEPDCCGVQRLRTR